MDLSQTTLLPPLDAFVPGVLPLFVLRLCGAMNICFPSAFAPCLQCLFTEARAEALSTCPAPRLVETPSVI
jgi:fucose permease